MPTGKPHIFRPENANQDHSRTWQSLQCGDGGHAMLHQGIRFLGPSEIFINCATGLTPRCIYLLFPISSSQWFSRGGVFWALIIFLHSCTAHSDPRHPCDHSTFPHIPGPRRVTSCALSSPGTRLSPESIPELGSKNHLPLGNRITTITILSVVSQNLLAVSTFSAP